MSETALRFSTPHRRRRPWPRLVLPLLLWLMSGCSLLMPPEIAEMESRTSAEALKLQRDDPAAFVSYKVGTRQMRYVDVGRGPDKPLVHGALGNEAATKTQTACSGSTCQRASTSRATHKPSSTDWRDN